MRRKSSKVARLPEEIRAAVNEQLGNGRTYDEISEWLAGQGYEVSRSSVHRYAVGYQYRLDQIAEAAAPAKEMLAAIRAGGVDLDQAETRLTQQMIVELLMRPAPEQAADVPAVLSAVARIQSLALRRREIELKAAVEKRAAAALEAAKAVEAEVVDVAKAQGLSDQAVDEIKKRFLGLKQ